MPQAAEELVLGRGLHVYVCRGWHTVGMVPGWRVHRGWRWNRAIQSQSAPRCDTSSVRDVCAALCGCHAQVRLAILTSTSSSRVQILTELRVDVDLAHDIPSKCVCNGICAPRMCPSPRSTITCSA